MTDNDLATALRHHAADEPPYDRGVADVLSHGRSTVRRARAIAGLVGAVGLSLAAYFVAPQLTVGRSVPDDRGVDAAIAQAIDAYDVTEMPRTMDEHARAILEGSVPALGPAVFVAFDSQHQKLPERYWPQASGLTVSYGEGTSHQLSVTLAHARGEAEGNTDGYCDQSPSGGLYAECTVTSQNGDVIITTLAALRLEWPAGSGLQDWRDGFMLVTQDEVDSTPGDRLWFSRDVKVIKSDTFITYVKETVRAPDLESARQLLVVPPADLEAIGLDPALVMPKPPPGENGCPQWTMPTMDVSCTGAG